MLWAFSSTEIQLLLYDCQLLGLRKAILNFVLVKQLAQGIDVECVVFVHRLLIWPLNPGDWQGLPNYGEEETSIRAPSHLKLPIIQRQPHTKTKYLGPSPSFVFPSAPAPFCPIFIFHILNLTHAQDSESTLRRDLKKCI